VWTPNVLRGAFGSVLKRLDADAYRRFFAPTARTFSPVESIGKRPSGLSDLPRPFVFRLGEKEIGLNLFLTSAVDLVRDVMLELGLELAAPSAVLHLPLAAQDEGSASDCTQRLRVHFLTPTELKGTGEPHAGPMFGPAFGSLMARVRDRISTLRALYGPGPLDLDFRAFGERAARVRMSRCELQTVGEERLSKRTGQRHSLGGFIGVAEYEGTVAEFVPYLEAARWTGVGRQTVWGKGEISVERMHA